VTPDNSFLGGHSAAPPAASAQGSRPSSEWGAGLPIPGPHMIYPFDGGDAPCRDRQTSGDLTGTPVMTGW
jgi:hypothetical protein